MTNKTKDFDKDFETGTEDFEGEVSDDSLDDGPGPRAMLSATSGSTPLDLARLGLSEIAYIRRSVVDETHMWTIHNAAGDPLGAAQSFDRAWAVVRQNDLEPVRVH